MQLWQTSQYVNINKPLKIAFVKVMHQSHKLVPIFGCSEMSPSSAQLESIDFDDRVFFPTKLNNASQLDDKIDSAQPDARYARSHAEFWTGCKTSVWVFALLRPVLWELERFIRYDCLWTEVSVNVVLYAGR